MRDLTFWALPVFRAFGIQVRVHLLFFVFALGLVARLSYIHSYVSLADALIFSLPVLFGTVLLHEYGHCFGGRYMGGEAEEILIWPLGGLAFVDVPRNWKAHTFMIASGPGVDVLICAVLAVALAGAGFLPSLNPVHEPFACEIYNFRDGRTYTSSYGLELYEPGSAEARHSHRGKPGALNDYAATLPGYERALASPGIVWMHRVFWLNWVLILFNLLPAYPLDGGQLLQGFIWARTDYRRGTTVACYSGLICGAIFMFVSIASNETMLGFLSIFMLFSSYMKLKQLEQDENPYGDFSEGYTSLADDDEDAPPRKPKPGFMKRWLIARTAKRMQRDLAQRQLDDDRMDQLLEKIARSGKASLTDEERRFMERVSERYRR